MRILALDTSAAASAALVDDEEVLAERTEHGARRHVEFIGPALAEILSSALPKPELVVVGIGPGPFTGLRAGIAAGIGVASGLGIPVGGVPSHDALALAYLTAHADDAEIAVLTDARRKEVYLSGYSGLDEAGLPARTRGPEVCAPAAASLAAGVVRLGRGAAVYADVTGAPASESPELLEPRADWLARVAARRRAAGVPLEETNPLYLREPDAQPSARRTTRLR